jgi:hypothetical protein
VRPSTAGGVSVGAQDCIGTEAAAAHPFADDEGQNKDSFNVQVRTICFGQSHRAEHALITGLQVVRRLTGTLHLFSTCQQAQPWNGAGGATAQDCMGDAAAAARHPTDDEDQNKDSFDADVSENDL